MRFGVLGPLAVWTDEGEPVRIPGAKVRALLADLLVHEGRAVSTDRLVDDLWGDEPPANPSGALQVRVSQLRKALADAEPGGRDLVVSRPPGYLLRVAADAVDADRFADLAARAAAAGDPGGRAALLTDALALWRGEPYADFGDVGFVRTAAARLAEQRLAVLEQQAEARYDLGEHALLAGELGELVARHPLRERLRAVHLRVLYRSGRQTEALDSYRDLRDRLADELGVDPGRELVALHRAILEQDPTLAPAAGPAGPARAARPAGNLPAPLTALVGREAAIAEVRDLLAAGRLVTLTGSGGVGKTRLAIETARQVADGYPDGVRLVELAGLDGSAGFTPADQLLAVLDVHDTSGDPAHLLTAALRDRRLLLVLDNCEHVVDAAAELVELVLRAAPGVRILATGREPLGLGGEVRWDVPPLEHDSAITLFAARAAATNRAFALDRDTEAAVALLCRRLDGIPLALELAATRVRALGVDGLVARLDDRFRLLATGYRGAPPRQRTLAAMIDWSWELLSGPERTVLRRLAVHAEGCTLAAAEAVCADAAPSGGSTARGGFDRAPVEDSAGVAGGDVLDLLVRLVDRSLVVAGNGPRYRLLESVAAYCADRMRAADETDAVRGRHLDHYLCVAEQAEPHLYGPEQRTWLRRLDAEAANFRAALSEASRRGAAPAALRLATALTWYWFLRGRLTEARRALDLALATPGPAPADLRARASVWRTGVAVLHGDDAGPAAGWDGVRQQLAEIADPKARARAGWFLGHVVLDRGALAESGQLVEDALATFREIGDRWGVGAALGTRAKFAHVRADLAALERDATASAAAFRVVGDRWGLLQATGWLGGLAEMTGRYDEASALYRDGLRMAEELGLWPEASVALSWLGWIAMQVGDFTEARELCQRALRLATEQSYRPGEVFAGIGLGFAARREGKLDLAEEHLRHLLEQGGDGAALHVPMVLIELGFAAEQRGDPAGAKESHLRAVATARRVDAARDLAGALDGLAGAAALAGAPVAAAHLLGAAAAARVSSTLPLAPSERVEVDRITAAVRARLDPGAFASAYDRGGALTLDEAIALVAD